jgi:uncharacterized protein (DUF1330 family)
MLIRWMAKGYLIVHVTVTDPEGHPKYLAAGEEHRSDSAQKSAQ